MAFRDRELVVPEAIPSGFEILNEERGAILWLSSSLNQLERVKSCKRRDALISALALMLEGSNVKEFLDSSKQLVKAGYEISNLERQLASCRKELSDRPINFVDRPTDHVVEPQARVVPVPQHQFSIVKFVLHSVIMFLIALTIVTKYLGMW